MRYRWVHKEDPKTIIEVVRRMKDRDEPPTQEELDAEGLGSTTPSQFRRRVESPLVSWRHIPAHGNSRFVSDPVFRDLREADKLEAESFNMHWDERDEINKEIKKLRGEDEL